jgi:hypothetical protein
MGSFRHPKFYDKATIESVRGIFYEVLDELVEPRGFILSDQRLKADIVERLLHLAIDGTPQDQWKSKVLSSLMFR